MDMDDCMYLYIYIVRSRDVGSCKCSPPPRDIRMLRTVTRGVAEPVTVLPQFRPQSQNTVSHDRRTSLRVRRSKRRIKKKKEKRNILSWY